MNIIPLKKTKMEELKKQATKYIEEKGRGLCLIILIAIALFSIAFIATFIKICTS